MENVPYRVFLWCVVKVQERKEPTEREDACHPAEIVSRVLPRKLETQTFSAAPSDWHLLTRKPQPPFTQPGVKP